MERIKPIMQELIKLVELAVLNNNFAYFFRDLNPTKNRANLAEGTIFDFYTKSSMIRFKM